MTHGGIQVTPPRVSLWCCLTVSAHFESFITNQILAKVTVKSQDLNAAGEGGVRKMQGRKCMQRRFHIVGNSDPFRCKDECDTKS